MADLSDSTNWSETDSSNNKASPNGWPEGMMPSGVNDSARSDKGALKRFWDRINPVQGIGQVAGVWTFVTANPAYPASYVGGEVYRFRPSNEAVGGDQFQVNGLPAKPILKRITTGTGLGPIAASDITGDRAPELVYDGTASGGAGAFILYNPYVPISGDGASGITIPGGGINASGPLVSTGINAGLVFQDRHNAALEWLWYADAGTARLYSGSDKVTVDNLGSLHAAGNLGGLGLYLTGGIYFNGIAFASSDGVTSRIFDGTGGNAIHLQAGINYYDADIHQFRTNGGVVSAAIYNDGTIALTGNYIHFAGSVGAANTTGGPLIFADNFNHVYKQGSGNGSWLFQNYAGATVASISSAGAINVASVSATGQVAGATINASSTVNAVTYDLSGTAFATNDGTTTVIFDNTGTAAIHLRAADSYYDADTHHFRSNVGAENCTISGAGTIAANGEIIAGGNLHAGASLFLGGPYILFNGNPSLSQGPYVEFNNTDWIARLGSGNGHYYFANSAGVASASIAANGTIAGIELRGGNGASDAGVLRGMPTADPTQHTIAFGWDQVNSIFYKITDNSRTDTLIWSDTIRALILAADGGAPSGWHLSVFAGATSYAIYVDFTVSDARLKRGIANSKVDALAALLAVPVRRFEWRKEIQATFGVPQKPVEIGLVAQDLLPHMPDCVGISEGREKPYPADTHTLMYDRIHAYTIRAIQQLEARIAQLEAQ